MKNYRIVLILLLMVTANVMVAAQDASLKEIKSKAERNFENDTTHISGWKKGASYTIGIGQGSSSNWAAGAETFSLSLSNYLAAFAHFREGRFTWRNTLDLGYALMNTTSLGTRKTDDKIDLFSKLGSDLNEKLSIGGVANFRTQFDKGLDYNYLGLGIQKPTSGFLAPAYAILAPGIDWHPNPYFSVFFSPIGARFVIVARRERDYYFENGIIPDSIKTANTPDFEVPLAVTYGVDPDKKIRTEVGGFASAKFGKEIFKNVVLNSRLDLYSNYLKTNRFDVIGPDQLRITKVGSSPEKVDVFWTNQLMMKINTFLNVSYNVDLIYDDDVRQFGPNGTSPAAQFRSMLTIGFNTSW